jgi:hypothetical protein
MALVLVQPAMGRSQPLQVWLDAATLTSWNSPDAAIPTAPKADSEGVDPRCRERARAPQSDEDTRLRARGWELVGDAQRRDRLLVILATANYDGMCRPRQYQGFVFRSGVFAGTLSPQLMDSRTDGALGRISLDAEERFTAEYSRYAASDPLCCPSRMTRVIFEVTSKPVGLRPVTATTRKT